MAFSPASGPQGQSEPTRVKRKPQYGSSQPKIPKEHRSGFPDSGKDSRWGVAGVDWESAKGTISRYDGWTKAVANTPRGSDEYKNLMSEREGWSEQIKNMGGNPRLSQKMADGLFAARTQQGAQMQKQADAVLNMWTSGMSDAAKARLKKQEESGRVPRGQSTAKGAGQGDRKDFLRNQEQRKRNMDAMVRRDNIEKRKNNGS